MAEQAESLPTAFCHNLSASRAPAATDDVTQGYRKGSLWVYGTTNTAWICTSNTVGAATWQSVTSGVAVWYKPL